MSINEIKRTKTRRAINTVQEEKEGIQSFLIESLGTCDIQTVNYEALYVTVEVQGSPLKLKVDTGAKCNVLSRYILNSLDLNDKIDDTKRVKLVSYSGNTIDTIGQTFLLCKYNGKIHKLMFHVIDKHSHCK